MKVSHTVFRSNFPFSFIAYFLAWAWNNRSDVLGQFVVGQAVQRSERDVFVDMMFHVIDILFATPRRALSQ